MNFKRGQAAMEYLMTYGWAILVIVIVLAALLYLGVFNLAGKTPDLCQFQVGLQCSSFRFDASNQSATLTIINGYQQKITVTQAICVSQVPNNWNDLTWTDINPDVEISAQQSQTITVYSFVDANNNQLSFNEGDAFTGKCAVEFYYTSEGSSANRRNIADVKFTAQP